MVLNVGFWINCRVKNTQKITGFNMYFSSYVSLAKIENFPKYPSLVYIFWEGLKSD